MNKFGFKIILFTTNCFSGINISKIDKVRPLFKLEEDYIHWFNKISKEIDFEIFDDNYVILYTFDN